MVGGALPAREPVQVESEPQVETVLDDRPRADPAGRVAEDVDDVGQAVRESLRLQRRPGFSGSPKGSREGSTERT